MTASTIATSPIPGAEARTLEVPGATLTYDIRRNDRTAEPPLLFGLGAAKIAADGLHRATGAAAKHGVSLSLHPAAFTMFRNARDVDLMITLLDPTYVNLCPDTAQFTVGRAGCG